MSVLTVPDVRPHLNIQGVSDDAELQDTIDAAEAAIGELVGPLTATTVTDRVPGWGYTLWLYTKPAVSLTSVTPVSGTALDVSTLYLKKESAGVERNDGGFFNSASYDVVYSAGRSSVPNDLKQAIKELVRHMWQTQRGAADRPVVGFDGGIASTLPGAAYTFPIRVQELLWPHLLPEFKTTGSRLRSSG